MPSVSKCSGPTLWMLVASSLTLAPGSRQRHQELAKAERCLALGRAPRTSQGHHGLHVAHPQQRSQRSRARAQRDQRAQSSQHAAIHTRGHVPQCVGILLIGEVDADLGEAEAERAAQRHQHERLQQALQREPPAPCTQRGAHGAVLLPFGGARPEQRRHVRAREQQEGQHGRQHDPQPLAFGLHQRLPQWSQPRAELLPGGAAHLQASSQLRQALLS